jgi:serine protease Do
MARHQPSISWLLPLIILSLALAPSACRRRTKKTAKNESATSKKKATTKAKTKAAQVKLIYPAAPGSFVKLVKQHKDAVVHLRTDHASAGGPVDWFPSGEERKMSSLGHYAAGLRKSLGSGLIIDGHGHVVTNAHIVGEGRKVWARLSAGGEFATRIVGCDPRTDFCLLQMELPAGKRVKGAHLGDSNRVQVGEWVLALGNPFGHGPEASAGIIRMLPRTDLSLGEHGYWGFIRTDTAVDRGNSGGPLLNTSGEVIGINTASSDGPRGLGFALPINTVKKLVRALKRDGKVVRTWIGMKVARVTAQVAKRRGLLKAKGALVTIIEAGGPAATAGLEKGDIVLSFNKELITNVAQLPGIAAFIAAGSEVPLIIWRNGKKENLTLRPEPLPQ